jgi:hypothetical protein
MNDVDQWVRYGRLSMALGVLYGTIFGFALGAFVFALLVSP